MDCPNCGAYNPEDRTQCWKCDDLLPTKKEQSKPKQQPGRMSMWTWIVLIILGALWFLAQCNRSIEPQPSSYLNQGQPAPIVMPLI